MPLRPGPPARIWIAGLALALASAAGIALYPRRAGDPDQVRGAIQADIRAGRLDAAEAALASLLRDREPASVDRMIASQLAEARGRHDEMLAQLARVADDDPLGPQARMIAGRFERGRHHLRAAESEFRRALKADPALSRARWELIGIESRWLREAEVREQVRALADRGPLTFPIMNIWTRSWDEVEDPAEAIAELRPAVEADPDDRSSRLALAEALRRSGSFDEADAILSPLPGSDPDARAIRARLASDRGDDPAAAALLAEGPVDHPGLARLRGIRALARQDGPEAVRQFRIAHAADPRNREAAFGLGHALRLVGEPAEAEPLLRAVRDQNTLLNLIRRAKRAGAESDRDLLRKLGATCEALGRLPEARGWYGLLIARDPLDVEAQADLSRLRDR